MKAGVLKSEKGVALIAVVILVLILSILGFSVLSVANSEILEARKGINRTKAFYLAEAGVARLAANLSNGNFGNIGETALGEGSFRVDFNTVGFGEPCAVATGEMGGEVGRVQVTLSFLAPPYECGMYAGGMSGVAWTLMLRGIGDPCVVRDWLGQEIGDCNGRDIINGNIFVDGNAVLYEQSSVNPAPWPNNYHLDGDVNATGSIDRYDSATIAGDEIEYSADMSPPDLIGMNYAVNNTHNVSQIFADSGIGWGFLPLNHELRNVFVKNPINDRNAECTSTVGDDYFLEPTTGFIEGNWKTAQTPMDVGNDRVYYIDGNLWVNSKSDTYGFNVHGKATIVVTGNVYICDNLKYADANSLLGIVALGKYDANGTRISGGDVIFGDPAYGTMYTFSSMMFAANDFLFNSKSFGVFPKEPESSFTLNGSMNALNRISLERDWYTRSGSERRPARYNPSTNLWYDCGTGAVLTAAQVATMKHYRMTLNYDDRVRSQSTQPVGLPRGTGLIFCGLTKWKELE